MRKQYEFVAGEYFTCRACSLKLAWDAFHLDIQNAKTLGLRSYLGDTPRARWSKAYAQGDIEFPYRPIRFICKACRPVVEAKREPVPRDYAAYSESCLREAQRRYGMRLGLRGERTHNIAFVYYLLFVKAGVTYVYVGMTTRAPKLRFQGHAYQRELDAIYEVSGMSFEPLDASFRAQLLASNEALIPKHVPSQMIFPFASAAMAAEGERVHYDEIQQGRVFEGPCILLNKQRPSGTLGKERGDDTD